MTSALVQDSYRLNHQIATVWHPDAHGDVLGTPHGNVRVLVGPAAYQLASGQIITL